MCDNRPARAKAFIRDNAFALAGRRNFTPPTQGYALGYVLAGLSGRFCEGAHHLRILYFYLTATSLRFPYHLTTDGLLLEGL